MNNSFRSRAGGRIAWRIKIWSCRLLAAFFGPALLLGVSFVPVVSLANPPGQAKQLTGNIEKSGVRWARAYPLPTPPKQPTRKQASPAPLLIEGAGPAAPPIARARLSFAEARDPLIQSSAPRRLESCQESREEASGIVLAGYHVPVETRESGPETMPRLRIHARAEPEPGCARVPAATLSHAPDFSWIVGQVEYSNASREWRLRYTSGGETDHYGGRVTLIETQHVRYLADGACVHACGHLVNPDNRGSGPTYYRIDSFSTVDTPDAVREAVPR